MTDTEKKIAEIRAKVTPIKHIPRGTGETLELLFNIQFLLDELERKDEENRKLRERLKEEIVWQDECLKLEEQLQSAQQDRDKLVEVLRWYADTKNYEYRTSYLDQDAPIIDDNGQRARDILREVGVTVE